MRLGPSNLGNQCPACLLAIGLEQENSETDPGREAGQKGRRLGDYELLEEIACGGMGLIYKARQISLNRTVAVKMLLAGSFAVPEFVQRFRTEAEAAASLHHPNIVPVHEFGQHEGQYFLVMDYVEGRNLGQLIRQQPLSPKAAAEYLKTIAEAVHYAHGQGILHRDLKPTNILVDLNNGVHVTDFGLAKRVASESDITITGQTIGSPTYSAPEQVAGKHEEVGPHSDVYSLGAMLYEMLTGRQPFVGESLTAVIHQVQEDEVVSPRLFNPEVPKDLESICLKCLEKEWKKRYGTADALAADLGRFLQGEATDARPIPMWGRGQRWCKRKPVVASLAASLALALITLAIASPIAILNITQQRDRAINAESQAKLKQTEAEAEAARVTEVLGLLSQMLSAKSPGQFFREKDLTVRQMLDEFSESISNRLTGDLRVEAEVRQMIGMAYNSLGVGNEALANLGRALALRREIYGNQDLKVAESLTQYAYFVGETKGWAESETLVSEAIRISEAAAPGSPEMRDALIARALFRQRLGNLTGAREDCDRLLSTSAKGQQDVRADIRVLSLAGQIAFEMGNLGEAERLLRAAVNLPRPDSSLSVFRGGALGSLGGLLANRGENAAAELMFREAITNLSWAAGDRDLGWAWPLQHVLIAQGKHDPALEPFFCRAAIRESNSPDRPTVSYRVQVETAGKYRLYLRWEGHGYHGDVVWAKICELADGPEGSVADVYRFQIPEAADADFATISPWQANASFEDIGGAKLPAPATWEITQSGIYTLQFVMNEAGCALDAFILQLDGLPPPTGDGPTESGRSAEGVFLESGGIVIAEAEHFSERSPGKDVAWRVVPGEDAGHVPHLHWRGQGYLQALPDLRRDATETVRAARAFVKAAQDDYAGALRCYQEFVQEAPGVPLRIHYLIALLQLRLGDVAGYRETCRQIMKTCEDTGPGADTSYAIWASALWPEATKTPERLVAWAEEASRINKSDLAVWMRLGTALYRSQLYDRAASALEQSHELWGKAEPKPGFYSPAYAWFFLAMTHQRLGNREQAKSWFDRAALRTEEEIRDERASARTSWNRRLTLELLKNQATQVLGIEKAASEEAPTAGPRGRQARAEIVAPVTKTQ